MLSIVFLHLNWSWLVNIKDAVCPLPWTAFLTKGTSVNTPTSPVSIVNDTFIITQDLIIKVNETEADAPVNWQCKFMPVKLSGSEEAVTNYKQFMISDG